MGGGDLNLKKSWHPSTMKNMEKVWKAEQQDHQEKKRIAELKREIEMEKDREDMTKFAMDQGVIEKKDDKKLDWMYKGPNQGVNREEYLLGRAIDKPFEQMARAEKDAELNRAPKNHVEHECIPPSLRFFSGSEQVDLARKLQEDPLYAIKKKEMETRSQLLKNPVKLKQLKQLLEEQARQSQVEKKGKKKKKKQKRRGSSDEELDNLLAAKYNKLKGKINEKDLLMSMKRLKKEKKAKKKKRKQRTASESEDDSDEDSDEGERDEKSRGGERMEVEERRRRRDFEAKSKRNHEGSSGSRDRRGRERSKSKERAKTKNKSHSKSKDDSSDDERSRGKSALVANYGLVRSDGTKIVTSHKSNSQEAATSHKKKVEEKRWVAPKRERLTEDEKERRRREMMENASWRDKERERNVKRYRDEEKRETTDKTYNKEFLRKHLAVAAETGTVASRIKANINNIQRSGRAMDTNFAKR